MDKKVLIVLAVISLSQALPVLIDSNSIPEVGASTQYKTEDNHGNYAFGYSEDHTSGGSFRKEHGDSSGNKIGSYGLHNADGRTRVVNYIADSAGFRANVHTNEPGVDPTQDSADVTVNKALVVAPAPALLAPAPALLAPAIADRHSVALYHPPMFHAPFTLASFITHGAHMIL